MRTTDTKLKNVRRIYHAAKTGFDSMMEPELLERAPDILTREECTPVTIGDHTAAINAMFDLADKYGKECWIP